MTLKISKILVRSGADIDRQNTLLNLGEVAFTTDTKRFFVGDNVTRGGHPIPLPRTGEFIYRPVTTGVDAHSFSIDYPGLSARLAASWMDNRYQLRDEGQTIAGSYDINTNLFGGVVGAPTGTPLGHSVTPSTSSVSITSTIVTVPAGGSVGVGGSSGTSVTSGGVTVGGSGGTIVTPGSVSVGGGTTIAAASVTTTDIIANTVSTGTLTNCGIANMQFISACNGTLHIDGNLSLSGNFCIDDGTPGPVGNKIKANDDFLDLQSLSALRMYTHGTQQAALCSSGLFVAGDVVAYASDGRLKENIVAIPDAIEKILEIRGVTFDWNDLADREGFVPLKRHDVGVIAQEVERVLPEAVTFAPFNIDYKSVRYDKIVPLLIEGIKELSDRVADLEEIIEKQNGNA